MDFSDFFDFSKLFVVFVEGFASPGRHPLVLVLKFAVEYTQNHVRGLLVAPDMSKFLIVHSCLPPPPATSPFFLLLLLLSPSLSPSLSLSSRLPPSSFPPYSYEDPKI